MRFEQAVGSLMLQCSNAMPVAGDRKPDWNAIGSQSVALFRHRCAVRPPDAGGRDAAFEPARALRPHQGAGGAVRRDAVRALLDRDDADAFRPPAACRGRRRSSTPSSTSSIRRRSCAASPPGISSSERSSSPRSCASATCCSGPRDRYPQIEIELNQVMSSEGLARVRGGTLDASFYFGAAAGIRSRLHPAARHRVPRGDACRLGRRARSTRRGRPSPSARGSSRPNRARIGGW